MSGPLLTDHQRRHLTVSVHLLLADLAQLGQRPELARDTPAADAVRAGLGQARRAAERLLEILGLDPPHPRSVRRQLLSIAGVWWGRVDELHAKALTGYGAVHPDLPDMLDPLVADLQNGLLSLAQSVQHFQED